MRIEKRQWNREVFHMECKKYSAGLMSQSFWFLEFKKAVKMRQEGMAYDDIKKKCVEENLFGAAKEYRALRMAGYIITRVKAMDDTLVDLRSEEHTSELQSRFDLVCRLLLEKKKKK